MFTILKKKSIENKYLIVISFCFFILRIINLTKLPIFNDEAIYLDWGFRETHVPGYLYYSLYDAKQPFLMWIFGIFESVFSNPLFGARLVSVLAGFLVLLGIYKLGSYLFNKRIALIAASMYMVIPIFSFFDRQALMESSISAVGIWACFYLVKNVKVQLIKNSVIAGIILGIGFFIKSTSLLFIFPYILISILLLAFYNNKIKSAQNLLVSIVAFCLTIFLLLINPTFWNTFQTNSRYTLTISEILKFPIIFWINNLSSNFQIAFIYLTPLVLLLGLVGCVGIAKQKKAEENIFITFFAIAFILNTLLIRIPTDRYLVYCLPFLLIPCSYVLNAVVEKKKIFGIILAAFVFAIPFVPTVYQIYNPAAYILTFAKYTTLNDSIYVNGFTSGYGIGEVVKFFNGLPVSKQIIIGVGENTGNPESAMFVYFENNKKVKAVYFDSRLLSSNLNNYACISTGEETYFVSRDSQLVGLDKFFKKIKTVKNPYGTNTIGIYKLIDNCKGKTLKLRLKLDLT